MRGRYSLRRYSLARWQVQLTSDIKWEGAKVFHWQLAIGVALQYLALPALYSYYKKGLASEVALDYLMSRYKNGKNKIFFSPRLELGTSDLDAGLILIKVSLCKSWPVIN